MIIDATNATVGRLASFIAKKALEGNKVSVVNCEKAILSGNKKMLIEKYKKLRNKGGSAQKGPYFPRSSEKILKRIIRGMLPNYRKGRGKEALKRVKCYLGAPKEFENEKTIKTGKLKKEPYIELKELCERI